MHLNEHIMDKLGETVERQTEISDKGWEGRMAVKMTMNDRVAYTGPSPLPGLCPELWWRPWWYSPPQCRELHSELDNLSDEYLSCLRKLQHCREELSQSQQPPPRVRVRPPTEPKWWWDASSLPQVLPVKLPSPCQHLASLLRSAWFTLYWQYSNHEKKHRLMPPSLIFMELLSLKGKTHYWLKYERVYFQSILSTVARTEWRKQEEYKQRII